MAPTIAPSTEIIAVGLVEQLEDHVREGDELATASDVAELWEAISLANAESDLDAITRLESLVSRLREWIADLEQPKLVSDTTQRLAKMLAVLERARTLASTAAVVERTRNEVGTVRERIEAALASGDVLRPRDLASELGVDITQVSRALREMKEQGRVLEAPAPSQAGDRRGRWYAHFIPSRRSPVRVLRSDFRDGMVIVEVALRADARMVAVMDDEENIEFVAVSGTRRHLSLDDRRHFLAQAERQL